MRTLLVVTGASRGLGRSIALAFVNKKHAGSISSMRAVLMARSDPCLRQTESLMIEEAALAEIPLVVSRHSIDLSDLDQTEGDIENIFSSVLPGSQFERTILINNAGSIGNIGSTYAIESLKMLRKSIDFNITGSMWLASRFIFHFRPKPSTDNDSKPMSSTVVNVSSLCAVEPFKTLGVYCAEKAARDMFHTIMAEETADQGVKVLNYAPGPCDTDMQTCMRESPDFDGELKACYVKSKEEGSLVKPEDTADRLVQLVLEGNFKSGSHIDFYDLNRNAKV